mmetsp:Transcript_6531/g.9495  ORF Transcript_6531/g.9495 Transcript_6531/m.9495 type:complete len:228 (+) Transcript_6531:120-803(+)|eukprot:CAMPEP_0195520604 /NCGR_PEP_ID=MMETSP0794_2-20130614/17260_1 /TAXON_ID=515487 /ORGANISM="Stephanopyxis turris, Strain CCMP 815" /LENGTH=227 /DNA_ID=CAMNT_0040649995 /DNA_START=115 /DNA_END=798 /DNA_ORIENTATION=+
MAFLTVTGCAQSNYPRQIYNKTTWEFLAESYRHSVPEHKRTIESSLEDGFELPYEVRDAPEKGRGVYVISPIRRGDLIYSGYQHAEFDDEHSFRKFLAQLPFALQCEILLWAYPMRSPDGGYVVSVELDDGSFINHGNSDREINAFENDEICDGMCALRDIEVGEQICMNYTEFISFNSLDWFDEIRSMAWRDVASTSYNSTTEYNQVGLPKSSVEDIPVEAVYGFN